MNLKKAVMIQERLEAVKVLEKKICILNRKTHTGSVCSYIDVVDQ